MKKKKVFSSHTFCFWNLKNISFLPVIDGAAVGIVVVVGINISRQISSTQTLYSSPSLKARISSFISSCRLIQSEISATKRSFNKSLSYEDRTNLITNIKIFFQFSFFSIFILKNKIGKSVMRSLFFVFVFPVL